MSEYTPKVGDRVRATLGENVLVGDVSYVDREGPNVDLGSAARVPCLYVDGWQFEQVVEVPAKLGAIIRLHRGVPFLLVRVAENKWWSIPSGLHYTNADVLDQAGFTVLFEGVDE